MIAIYLLTYLNNVDTPFLTLSLNLIFNVYWLILKSTFLYEFHVGYIVCLLVKTVLYYIKHILQVFMVV